MITALQKAKKKLRDRDVRLTVAKMVDPDTGELVGALVQDKQTSLQKEKFLVPGKKHGRRQYFKEPELFRFGRMYEIDARGCWVWTGGRMINGYARFGVRVEGKRKFAMVLAHRWAYKTLVGPIQEGLVIDHLCRNRACVNPAHLEVVTYQENNVRAIPFRNTHTEEACKNGHPWTKASRYVGPTGKIDCRICRNISAAKTKSKRRAK